MHKASQSKQNGPEKRHGDKESIWGSLRGNWTPTAISRKKSYPRMCPQQEFLRDLSVPTPGGSNKATYPGIHKSTLTSTLSISVSMFHNSALRLFYNAILGMPL